MRKRNSGVTLIELMIVVAIVAILASIALPSYRVYMLRTHRAQAKAALMQIQVAQEKFFLQNNRYISTTGDMTRASPNGLGIPDTTENGMYAITIASGSTNTNYTAVATARSSQTDDTACPVFTIDETGSKTPVSGECWK